VGGGERGCFCFGGWGVVMGLYEGGRRGGWEFWVGFCFLVWVFVLLREDWCFVWGVCFVGSLLTSPLCDLPPPSIPYVQRIPRRRSSRSLARRVCRKPGASQDAHGKKEPKEKGVQ